MAKFLFISYGTSGDIYPYLSIAKDLNEKGHQAIMLCPDKYEKTCSEHNIMHRTLGPSFELMGGYDSFIKKAFNPISGAEYWIRKVQMRNFDSIMSDILKVADEADVIISHPIVLSAPLVAEKLKKVWVSTALAPISMFSNIDRSIMAPPLTFFNFLTKFYFSNRIFKKALKICFSSWENPVKQKAKQLGVKIQKNSFFEGQFSPFRHLVLFDTKISFSQKDWNKNVKSCRVPILDEKNNICEKELDSLEVFLNKGEKPIVFTLGTSGSCIANIDFWKICSNVVEKLNMRAVFITGLNCKKILKSSEHVYECKYIPHSYLLKRSSLIVHQGGMGIICKALRFGVPQLVLPIAWDQPDNAYRLKKIGVAEKLPFKQITEKKLIKKINKCIKNSNMGEKSKIVSTQILQEELKLNTPAEELILLYKGCKKS